MPVPFDQNILNLLERDIEADGIAVLAGAGLSLAPPACAPLFRSLRDSLLETLSESLTGTLDESIIDACRSLFNGKSEVRRDVEPVPEVLFEALYSILHDRLFDALRVFLELPVPNANHCFVADLANHGLRLLITTNFENGFEQALHAAGFQIEVCADGTSISESLNNTALKKDNKKPLPVWKPHGTLEHGAEETIRVTLSQVAKERMDPQKFGPIIAVTAHMPLLVIGYSGYDADLSRALIQAGEQGRRLYWLSYSEPEQNAPPLRILKFWQDRGKLMVGEPGDLFSQLAGFIPGLQTFEHPAGTCSKTMSTRLKNLKHWVDTISVKDRLAALSALCWKLSDYDTAVAVVDVLQELSVQKRDGSGLLFCLIMRTNILRSAGRGSEIGPILNDLVKLREHMGQFGDPEFSELDATLLHEIGGHYKAQGDHTQALNAYRKALKISRITKDAELTSTIYQSMGALLSHRMKLKEAKELFESALTHAVKTGHREAELKARHELGIIAYEEQDYEAASASFTENIRQAHEIGDVGIESSGTFELAMIALRVLQDYDQAHTLLTRAQRLAGLIGNKSTELMALLYLGDLEHERDRSTVAIEILIKCADSAAELGEGSIEATALSRRARCYALMGERDKAKTDLERARPLAERWHPALIVEIDSLSALL
jgi:tetratricopeptide (TPR) repeat protein